MQGFHDAGELEFDWFPEGQDLRPVDYQGLEDLREQAENVDLPEEANALKVEDDGMWRYCESLTGAAAGVFGAIYVKLCGREPAYGELMTPSSYVEQLSGRCEVVRTALSAGAAKTAARMEACLTENGCVAAMVSDAQWRRLLGEEESPFFDSGIRMLQIVGMDREYLTVRDFAYAQGCSLPVSRNDFCALDGVLLEVYK